MKVGVWIPAYRRWVRRDTVRQLAVHAESMGFGSLWVQDHLVAPIGDASEQPVDLLSAWLSPDDYGNEKFSAVEYFGEQNWWLDPYVLWGYLAACTSRCELGSSIIVLPYRDPIVQAKMLGTLDVLSGGRMLFGVGVGHVPGEFEALSVPYVERGRLTDEYLDVIAALLSQDEVAFEGPTIRFDPVLPLIQPVSRPHPPFLVGGTSKRAVRRAVDKGNGWIPAHLDPPAVAEGLAYAAEYARERGRNVPPVSLAVVWGLTGEHEKPPAASRRTFRSISETSDLISAYAAVGVERLAVDVPNPNLTVTLKQFELLAEAARKVGALA